MDDQSFFFSGDEIKDLQILEQLYKEYYVQLCVVSKKIVRDSQVAEEIVSDVFINFWNKRGSLVITHSVKSYLFQSARNTAINHIKSKDYVHRAALNLGDADLNIASAYNNSPMEQLFEIEMFYIIENEINLLPGSCRKIFLLSREKGLTYCQIASVMDISVNTVKTQIKIALQRLRVGLKKYILSH